LLRCEKADWNVRVFHRLFYFGLFLLLASPSYAYLDPGTGSLLLYAIMGIAVTALFAIRALWYTLKGKAYLVGTASVSTGMPDIVFHSEGGYYWQVFEPVIASLARDGASCAYVTPDPTDPGLSAGTPHLKAVRPGGNMATIAWMNAVRGGVVVSTTPHLDVYMLKRSKHVKRYVHLFHAPTDIVFYEKYAFDWYDCLLIVGSFQKDGIRELERKRGTPVKELLPTGCTYFDYMLEEISALPTRLDRSPAVLYAPAWGVRSSVLTYGSGIIDSLISRGMKVIFRPHPQFYVSHSEIIRDIEKRLAETDLVEIDRNRTGISAMVRSDLLITDLSGVLFDYACLFGRPILLANSDADPGGQEGEDLSGDLWDVQASKELAYALVDELESLPDLVTRARRSTGEYRQKAQEFRDRTFYNFGEAGPAAAGNIMSVFRSAS
jgi:hypothetical protein